MGKVREFHVVWKVAALTISAATRHVPLIFDPMTLNTSQQFGNAPSRDEYCQVSLKYLHYQYRDIASRRIAVKRRTDSGLTDRRPDNTMPFVAYC